MSANADFDSYGYMISAVLESKRRTPMKNMLKAMAGIVLLAAFGGIGSAYGQNHMYTNAVLKGCYGFLVTSVDTEGPNAARENRDAVGTFCFDGMTPGHIIANVGALDQTGVCTNTNGTTTCIAHIAGKYTVTNAPGQGMGTFTHSGCVAPHVFSIFNVVDGIAQGFHFMRVFNKSCAGPFVLGGTAYLQEPHELP